MLDTTLWIDLTRSKSPPILKAFAASHISDAEARVAEPIIFEMLRCATDQEAKLLAQYFKSIPQLPTPLDVWSRAAELGRDCRKNGITVGPLDLIISIIAIHHRAELITFDDDFQKIAGVSTLQVQVLLRPSP